LPYLIGAKWKTPNTGEGYILWPFQVPFSLNEARKQPQRYFFVSG
jgi:hypothetical protein